MSSDLFPTVKSRKHVLLSIESDVMHALIDETKRDQRSLSYVVSRIVGDYYEEKKKLKIV